MPIHEKRPRDCERKNADRAGKRDCPPAVVQAKNSGLPDRFNNRPERPPPMHVLFGQCGDFVLILLRLLLYQLWQEDISGLPVFFTKRKTAAGNTSLYRITRQ
jgi:hypothetical protein